MKDVNYVTVLVVNPPFTHITLNISITAIQKLQIDRQRQSIPPEQLNFLPQVDNALMECSLNCKLF